MLRPIAILALAAAFCGSLCAVPARAVIRFDRIGPGTDTLFLPPEKLKTFRNSLRAGGDLSTAGTYLFAASMVVPIVAAAVSNLGVGEDGAYEAIGAGCLIGSQAGFIAMATGNLIASRASRLDTARAYSLNHRLVPTLALAALTWGGAAVAYNSAQCGDGRGSCLDPLHVFIPMAAELILAPILRIQFNRAFDHLGGLILAPAPRGATLSFAF